MQLYEIEYFLAIASARNLNSAAKILFISPSALSMFLTKLERRLGTTLFIRTKDSLQLTAAGEIYYEAASQIAQLRNNAIARIAALSAPTDASIRFTLIGGRATEFATVFLPVLRQRFPHHSFLLNQETDRMAYAHVADGSTDFAIGALDHAQQKNYKLICLCREEIGLLIPEDHHINKILQEKGVSPDDPVDISLFNGETFVLCEKGTVIVRTSNRYFQCEHFTPTRTFHSAMKSIGIIARLNHAIGFCPRGYFREGEGLIFQRMKNPMYYELGIIFQRERTLSPTERNILSVLQELKDSY